MKMLGGKGERDGQATSATAAGARTTPMPAQPFYDDIPF
jgi:hypothetical protein